MTLGLAARRLSRYRRVVEGSARAAGLRPGTRLGRYTLLRRIAVGGMAELYLAHQRGAAGFAKIVALKRILPHLAEDPTFTRMFLDEARLASALDHPNLAHVLDFGEHDGEHFLTMEYVHGRDLLKVLKAEGKDDMPLGCALTIVSQVARGLHDLHEQRSPDGRALGLVHRDISPSNVLVSFDGEVKLTDFGIAKAMELTAHTRSGTFKGKLGHSSPEQARGEEIDRRSDVFCLGILLYEATTGARAFSGKNEFAVLGKVARGDYVTPREIDPDYPDKLEAIVARALQVDPGERFGTALAMADAIEEFAREHGLRLSTDAVVATMRRLFGPPPPMVHEEELRLAEREATAPTPVADPVAVARPPAPARSRAMLYAIPLAMLVGAGGAWALGRQLGAEAPQQPAAGEAGAAQPDANEATDAGVGARPDTRPDATLAGDAKPGTVDPGGAASAATPAAGPPAEADAQAQADTPGVADGEPSSTDAEDEGSAKAGPPAEAGAEDDEARVDRRPRPKKRPKKRRKPEPDAGDDGSKLKELYPPGL